MGRQTARFGFCFGWYGCHADGNSETVSPSDPGQFTVPGLLACARVTAGEYLVGVIRLALLLLPAGVGCRCVRGRLLSTSARSLGWLIDVILAVAAVVVGAELLGVFAVNRWWTLTVLLWVAGWLAVIVVRRCGPDVVAETGAGSAVGRGGAPRPPARRVWLGVAGAAMAVVWGQWVLLTSDAYGGGIVSFDSLWYHLPFSAFFAQTGSVSGVLFTQADPFVAYYPANSELLHAIGLLAMRSDLLSPMLNLVWLAVALLGAWCLGRPWRIEPVTLTCGCVIMGLPILGALQPGSAFTDTFGLAFLMAAVALAVQLSSPPAGLIQADTRFGAAESRARAMMLVACGLALGLSLGTKVTFAAPAVVIVCGTVVTSPAGRRVRTLVLMGLPCLLTGGWWYLRATLDTGNPLGLRVHVGPIVLPGPVSPLADAASQTVISALAKPDLWSSRLAPGLDYALGPLWPGLVLCAIAGLIAAMVIRAAPVVLRVIAAGGAVAILAYLVFPTGASAIEQQTQLFAVNLRYAIPAIAIGLLLGVVLADRRPRLVTALSVLLLAVLLVTQLQAGLWPTQTGRHAVFLVAAAVVVLALWAGARLPPQSPALRAGVAGAAILCVIAGFAVERHYFARRYLSAVDSATPLGQIYRWAQGVSNTSLALYGTVEQYPLYGARVTNRVTISAARQLTAGTSRSRPAPPGGEPSTKAGIAMSS
jgi:hypothetical protein